MEEIVNADEEIIYHGYALFFQKYLVLWSGNFQGT